MKINSHIIPLDNMATVAILTLGEMVERVMLDGTASTCVNPDMVYERLTDRCDGTTPRSTFNCCYLVKVAV